LKLRYEIRNTECDETTAVRQYWELRSENQNVPPHGIIGARCSGVSVALARVSGLECVPMLSPASNSAQLSKATEFPFFFRLVAPSNERGEVGAMIALLRSFGWQRVRILATDTELYVNNTQKHALNN
jgi:ABC-type branched-subunit amino acid transport system substrate-binding protein